MNLSDEVIIASANATAEVAKTTGKAIDAACAVGGFIAKTIGGSLEQGIGIFEDKLKWFRWERQIRLISKADELLYEAGLKSPTKLIPMKLAIPFLQGASMEEDDQLQDRWINLLVNCSNADFRIDMQRSYIDILERLTPLDAQILEVIYAISFEEAKNKGIITLELPQRARIALDSETEDLSPSHEVQLSLSNLDRMGCLKLGFTFGGGEAFGRINPTLLGHLFVKACSNPKKI